VQLQLRAVAAQAAASCSHHQGLRTDRRRSAPAHRRQASESEGRPLLGEDAIHLHASLPEPAQPLNQEAGHAAPLLSAEELGIAHPGGVVD
jgi:hypothetical protein